MYRRLVTEYVVFNVLRRIVVFTFGIPIFFVLAVALALILFQYQLSPQDKWKFVQVFVLAGAFTGCFLGVLLGLHDDIRVFLNLYRAKRKSTKFFAGMDTHIINRYMQVSEDGTRQIRLTQDDAQLFEHYHCEILDPVRSLTLENYVYGKSKKISEAIWYYINPSNIPRQIAFLETSKISSNPAIHISCKWSETVENAETQLPSAQMLLIAEMRFGVYLFRFSEELYYAGDTWHQTMADAKMQAAYEYGIADDAWQVVPDDVSDMIEFFSDQKREIHNLGR